MGVEKASSSRHTRLVLKLSLRAGLAPTPLTRVCLLTSFSDSKAEGRLLTQRLVVRHETERHPRRCILEVPPLSRTDILFLTLTHFLSIRIEVVIQDTIVKLLYQYSTHLG